VRLPWPWTWAVDKAGNDSPVRGVDPARIDRAAARQRDVDDGAALHHDIALMRAQVGVRTSPPSTTGGHSSQPNGL